MKVAPGVIVRFGELIAEAEETIMESITDGRIPDEPAITNRFIQALEMTVNQSGSIQGVQFRARTLTSLGPHAEEKEVGADFVGVLDIQLPGFTVSKGFLCQAKKAGKGMNVDYAPRRRDAKVGFDRTNELQKLKVQINKMLNISPDSFVVVYTNSGFVFIPALSVDGIQYINDGNYIYGKNTRLFFQEFLLCFIGDRQLGAYDDKTLTALVKETRSRYAITFQLRKAGRFDDF